MNYLKPKDFKKRYGNIFGTHFVENNTHVIEVPYHASTKTRLHELGHVHFNHGGLEIKTLNKIYDEEIQAEKFTYEKMNKPIDGAIIIPAIGEIAEHVGIHHLSWLFNRCIKTIEQSGIKVNKNSRSFLWQMLKKELEK